MQELSGVSEAARELAMSRFRLIQPHLEKNRPLQLVAFDSKHPFRNRSEVGEPISQIWPYSIGAQARDDRGGRRVVSPKIKAAIEALAPPVWC
jgi:putative transposase